jgi:hypothetical protein
MGDDRVLGFDVEARRSESREGARACFALGVRKSGSSIFSSVVSALAQFNGLNVVDIPGTMFQHGYRYVDWNGYRRLSDLLWRGNVYIGFRDPPTALYGDPVFAGGAKILLVRDPRDALVSEYFSNAFSHSLPGAGATSVIEKERGLALASGVEEYALKRVQYLNRTVAGYRALLKDPHLKIMRYEDVIFAKDRWIRDIAAHYGWAASDELVTNILSWADVRPDVEDPKAFIRHVAPGDHLDKLSPDAIGRINGQLSDMWSQFGYVVAD